MKTSLTKKIISILIISLFSVSIITSPKTEAAGLNWDNPNAKGDSQFRLSTSKASTMISAIVGCTGIISRISNAVNDFLGKATSVIDSNVVPTGDKKILTKAEETAKREECINGIAYALAKNQLTKMTRDAVNWVNTGFNGDPMYVREMTSFTNSLEKNVLERNINMLVDPNNSYPYGTDFSESVVTGYRSGSSLKTGGIEFLDTLRSDLSSFVNDPESYYSYENENGIGGSGGGEYGNTGNYGIETTKTAQQRAKDANDRFANDFSAGGWDGYLALTQRDQNNPLGFSMLTSQYLANQQQQEIQKNKDELTFNNGFLSQKRCAQWQLYDNKQKPITESGNCDKEGEDTGLGTCQYVYNKNKQSDYDKCVKFESVTPGSIIKENLSSYINSPQRQTELADAMNEALNSLFAKLLQKFQGQGLSSLSSFTKDTTDWSMSSAGFGSNDVFDTFGNNISSDIKHVSGGDGFNDSFDITKDLGDTYTNAIYAGKWNPKTNTPELLQGVGEKNHYYIVSVAGEHTHLIPEEDTPHYWKVGDKVFFDGENWMAGIPTKIIEKKGIIHIQKDYIARVNVLLKDFPKIMPAVGELDYCIPGPNLRWENNSFESKSAYFDYLDGVDERKIPTPATGSTLVTELLVKALKNYYLYLPDWTDYENTFNDWVFNWANIKTDNIYTQAPFFTIFYPLKDPVLHPGRQTYVTAVDTSNVGETGTGLTTTTGTLLGGLSGILPTTLCQVFSCSPGQPANIPPVRTVEEQKKWWYDYSNTLWSEYKQKIAERYGNREYGAMRVEFNEDGTDNENYLEMAEAGLDITRNAQTYYENIKSERADYEEIIRQTKANIYKLEKIKKRVDEIVAAAQKRRAQKRKDEGLPPLSPSCIENENINYQSYSTTGTLE
jgi:hypothetical protein